MLNISLKHKARQLSRLIRDSITQKRHGQTHRAVMAQQHELGMTFIGHSGFLLQMAGRNVLIDPNFAQWLFLLKRLRRPGLRIRELPAIDYVLVTHAHFDHLHRPSLRRIARQTRRLRGTAPAILVPHGVGELVADLGYERVIEMRVWQQFTEGDLSVTMTPARHWGARMITDTHRGFGGYVVRGDGHSVYHAGDTAYFAGFKEIGARLQPEIALLPIGAYQPESYRAVHTSPEDAMQAFVDLGAKRLVPMHYGTFKLSHEPMDEPVARLRAAAEKIGMQGQLEILEEGMTRIFV